MLGIEVDRHASEIETAIAAFHPERFGCRPWHDGWVVDLDGIGTVALGTLSWQHARAVTATSGDRSPSALHHLVELQGRVWGMPPEEVVPVNLLAVIEATGGSVLVAFQPNLGFTDDGWLGFALAMGSRSGSLVAHMMAVREDVRGSGSLGWLLKIVQAYEALRTGHTAAAWTFDPMRGANARLNIEKLGAKISELTLDRYGALRSALYGDVPSDRFTADWDLIDPATAERISAVAKGQYAGPGIAEVADLPEVTIHNLQQVIAAETPRLRYRIPANIDELGRRQPEEAIQWRREMRQVFGRLLLTKSARIREHRFDPFAVSVRQQPGGYEIDGFATGFNAANERISFYLLRRQAP